MFFIQTICLFFNLIPTIRSAMQTELCRSMEQAGTAWILGGEFPLADHSCLTLSTKQVTVETTILH